MKGKLPWLIGRSKTGAVPYFKRTAGEPEPAQARASVGGDFDQKPAAQPAVDLAIAAAGQVDAGRTFRRPAIRVEPRVAAQPISAEGIVKLLTTIPIVRKT